MNKNDRNDAEAIATAVRQGNMRFVLASVGRGSPHCCPTIFVSGRRLATLKESYYTTP
jgi:hypothetical protein